MIDDRFIAVIIAYIRLNCKYCEANPCGVFPAPFSGLQGARGALPGSPPARVSPRKNCPPDSFFSPSCASLRIIRSVPARRPTGYFALCGVQRERILQNRTFILRCAAKPLRLTPQVCLRKHRLCRTFLRFEEHEGLRPRDPRGLLKKAGENFYFFLKKIIPTATCL